MKKYYINHSKGTTSIIELEVEPLLKMECYTNGLNAFALHPGELYYKIVKSKGMVKDITNILSSFLSDTKEEAIGKAQAEIIDGVERDAEKAKMPIDKAVLEKKLSEIQLFDCGGA